MSFELLKKPTEKGIDVARKCSGALLNLLDCQTEEEPAQAAPTEDTESTGLVVRHRNITIQHFLLTSNGLEPMSRDYLNIVAKTIQDTEALDDRAKDSVGDKE